MKKLCVLFWFGLSISNTTHAVTPECQESKNTIEMDECMSNAVKQTEQRLNAKYKKILSILSEPDDEIQQYSVSKKAVIESQKAWVKLREKDCYAESTMLLPPTGTAAASMHMQCMIDYANRRIRRLEVFDPKL